MTALIRSLRDASALALCALALSLTSALAQGPALSLLPQDQSSRPASPWSVFSTPVAPVPAQEPAAAEPETADPAPAKASTPMREPGKAVASKLEPKPKSVNVPLPPVPDAAIKAQRAALAPPPPPPARKEPSGWLALFANSGAPPVEAPQTDAAERDVLERAVAGAPASTEISGPASQATQVAKLDVPGAAPSGKPPASGLDEEGLDDEDALKIADKQIDSVQIACLKPSLMAMIKQAGDHFGDKPVITSGYRAHGRRGSYHRKCEAADFFIPNVSSGQLVRFLRALPGAGGVGTYCHTKSVHLDTGEARNWHQCGFRRSFALRVPVLAETGSR